ncbi:unnamed protein product, partial [marine sediment metagenome]
MKNGWYYIKLRVDESNWLDDFEDTLPPTRCIEVLNNTWLNSDAYKFLIKDWMILSPAFTVGKDYEFSNTQEHWVKGIYAGIDYPRGHMSMYGESYTHC